MTEERYKRIKDSIELQSLVKKQIGVEDELLQEEIELLKAYEKLQKENKKLNGAIQTYDILLKANVEENKQLKEQLKKQQKEFIHFLEDEKDILIKEISHYYIDSFDRQHAVNETIYDEVEMILQKYKEIIGDDK